MDYSAIGMIDRGTVTQDVDAMWEADAAAEWERINECESDKYPYWTNAEYKLSDAQKLLSKAEDCLGEAAEYVKDSSQDDRIMSLMDDASKLYDAIYEQLQRMKVM